MINSLYCQDLTKSALSTVSEGEPSSTLFAVLCIDILAFFFFSTLCKNYSPDWSGTECCAILLHNEANAELRKAGKKNSQDKNRILFFLRTMRSNFFNFLIQRINLISQIKSRMNASGEFLTFKRR